MLWFSSFSSSKVMQACTYGSPHAGPLRDDAPPWCQSPFEPEGIVSISFHYVILLLLSFLSIFLIFIDCWNIHAAIPLNKQLYSFSYVCVTAGAAAIVFCIFYFLVLH
ncbi:hypothetical protein BHE74_00014828 [Ensete ventricosum]|nr:hypothetical protein GW17_00001134 [Ensete ventricosum]RWW77032.1 hypothetical protein BHE74_00014828 [Ensete ventricosum]